MSQPLQLSFQTNTDQARNAIAQLASTVATNMVTIGSAMKTAYENQGQLVKGLESIGTAARGAVAGFIAFEAISFAIRATAQAAEEARQKLAEIVAIANNARNAGVGTNFFQQWTAQAKDLNLEVGKLQSMLDSAREASNQKIGEGGEKGGSQIGKRLGLQAGAGNITGEDVKAFEAITNQEDRIKFILDLLDRLKAELKDKAAFDIAGKFFGPDFEKQMRNGVDVIGKMRESFNTVKDVAIPPDVIARGVELNKQLDEADRKMREGWLPIQQDILRWQQDELASLVTIKQIVADIALSLGQWYVGTKNAADEASRWVNNLPAIKAAAKWAQDMAEGGGIFGKGGLLGPPSGLEILTDADRKRLQDERDKAANPNKLPDLNIDDKSKDLPKTKESKEAKTALESYMDSLQKSVAVLEAETRTFGKSNIEKARDVDLTKAQDAARKDSEDGKRKSKELTDEETKAVLAQADAEGKAKDRTEQLQRAHAAANEQAQLLGNTLISALDKIGQSGVKATDVLKDMLKTLIKAVEQALLLGSGPFANLFQTQGAGGNTGGLAGLAIGGIGRAFGGGGSTDIGGPAGFYGPGFASGGMVGRDGSPMFIPYSALASAKRFDSGGGIGAILHPGEVVLNAAQQRNVAGSMMGGAKINVTHAPVINGTGLSKEEIFSLLQRNNKEFSRQIGPIFSDWQRRYG